MIRRSLCALVRLDLFVLIKDADLSECFIILPSLKELNLREKACGNVVRKLTLDQNEELFSLDTLLPNLSSAQGKEPCLILLTWQKWSDPGHDRRGWKVQEVIWKIDQNRLLG